MPSASDCFSGKHFEAGKFMCLGVAVCVSVKLLLSNAEHRISPSEPGHSGFVPNHNRRVPFNVSGDNFGRRTNKQRKGRLIWHPRVS